MLTTALEEHEDFFIDHSVYLVLEKLKNVIYRNIFKRVCVQCYKYTKLLTNMCCSAAAVAPETKLNLDWFQVVPLLQLSNM